MANVRTMDVLKSITNYDTIISTKELNEEMTAHRIICAEPFFITRNKMSVEHRKMIGMDEYNVCLLLVGGNTRSITGKKHCWAFVRSWTNKGTYPIYHKRKGLWAWHVDSVFEYNRWDGSTGVSIILGEQLDKGYTLQKTGENYTPFDKNSIDFKCDYVPQPAELVFDLDNYGYDIPSYLLNDN